MLLCINVMWVGVGNTRWLLVLLCVNGEVVVVSIGLGVWMFPVFFARWRVFGCGDDEEFVVFWKGFGRFDGFLKGFWCE